MYSDIKTILVLLLITSLKLDKLYLAWSLDAVLVQLF